MAENFLKIGEDRDGAAFAGEGWRTTEGFVQCAAGGKALSACRIEGEGFTAVAVRDLDANAGRAVFLKMASGQS